MPSAALAPTSSALAFQDSRSTGAAPRDLAPVIGVLSAVAVSAVLWAAPITVWLLIR